MNLIHFIVLGLLVAAPTVNASTEAEIQHLLKFVATTECQYERNGTFYTGNEAVTHIKKKYDYFVDDIQSTEDFIQYAATKSKMSGKYYRIHCPNAQAENSRDWLLAELQRYRRTQD